MSRTAKKAGDQQVIPLVTSETARESVVPLAAPRCDVSHPPGAVTPRCSCYDYDDGDEYRPPQSYAQRLLAFVSDLVAHGASTSIGTTSKKPPVTKSRRRAG